MATVSPTFASFVSSCTMNFEVRRSVLPYSPCRTCHSTATTPTFSDFAAIGALCCPLLPQHRFHSRQIASDGAEFVRRFELPHRLLDAHPEQLIRQIPFLRAELVDREITQFGRLHWILS